MRRPPPISTPTSTLFPHTTLFRCGIGPMLRTLRVPARTRDILKGEGIVNDPIGALLGAAIYAYITYAGVSRDAVAIGFDIAAAAAIATGLGVALGYAVTTLFPRGYVPEFLMAPVDRKSTRLNSSH